MREERTRGDGKTARPKLTGYVVKLIEHLRDGQEECAKVFGTLDAALAWINDDFFAKSNMTFRLFKLGREIPLRTEKFERQQPPVTTERFVLDEPAAEIKGTVDSKVEETYDRFSKLAEEFGIGVADVIAAARDKLEDDDDSYRCSC